MDARLHGMGGKMTVHRTLDVLPARVLFTGTTSVGLDDLDKALRGMGKLPSKWADRLDHMVDDRDSMDVSDNGASLAVGRLGQRRQCDRTCGENIGAMGATLQRVAEILVMLVAGGGLASPTLRLAVEKHKGMMV